jgi:uncharacterized protein YqeY
MLLDEFKKAKIEAMKAHDQEKVTALNVIINKLMLLTIEKRAAGKELDEADVSNTIQKAERELIEEKEAFEKAGRTDTVASLEKQLAAIRSYLPKLMTAEEIKAVILSLPDKTVPAVMKHFRTEYPGKCDMKMVSEVLKQL